MRHAHFDTVSAEADGVAAMIAERIQAGARPRDFAILVRSNADADPFLRALNVQGLPHRFSGSRGLYAREEVRLLVSFLRVLANPDDSVSLFYLAASEVYGMPEGDLLRLNHYARRKTRPLLEVLRGLPENEDLASVSGKSRDAAARLLADLERATGEVPRRRTGEVLYGFLQWSGLLGRLAKESSAEAEAKVRNIARFFEVVKAYGDVAEHDRVPAFVAHLDLLREAGDDPAVAEADLDEDAVHVLTVHKAKGLEFPHVFLVGCAESKFPLQRRGDPVGLPEELVKEEMTGGGNGHLLEERRLFYVAMTRARDELVLTSASDYGTSRARKVSRFVVEALDLPSPKPLSRKTSALEALARNAPAPEPPPPGEVPIPEDELLRLSYGQIDDYETCPLKYRYVHVLRVPLLTHHAVVYGHAVHEAVRRHFEARLAGRAFSADDLVAAFRAAWVSEGFLSREHEERAPARGGGDAPAVPRGGGGRPVVAHRGRGGVRVRPREEPRPGPLRPRDRAGGRGRDRGLQDRRRARREGRPEAGEGEPAARHLRPRAPEDEGPAARASRAALPRVGARGRAPPRRRGGGGDGGAHPHRRRRHPPPRVPGEAHLHGLRPVPVPGHLPPHRVGAGGGALKAGLLTPGAPRR